MNKFFSLIQNAYVCFEVLLKSFLSSVVFQNLLKEFMTTLLQVSGIYLCTFTYGFKHIIALI